jgi:hypothetical protein
VFSDFSKIRAGKYGALSPAQFCMPVHQREFVVDGEAVTIEIDEDAGRVTVETSNRPTVAVDVDGATAIVNESVPGWAEGPLAELGIRNIEVRE